MSSASPKLPTRAIKENHSKQINVFKWCPFGDCNNLFITCTNNKVFVYDATHLKNYIGGVFYWRVGNKSADWMFTCVTWIKIEHGKAEDLWLILANNIREIYVVSVAHQKCINVIRVKHNIKDVSYYDDKSFYALMDTNELCLISIKAGKIFYKFDTRFKVIKVLKDRNEFYGITCDNALVHYRKTVPIPTVKIAKKTISNVIQIERYKGKLLLYDSSKMCLIIVDVNKNIKPKWVPIENVIKNSIKRPFYFGINNDGIAIFGDNQHNLIMYDINKDKRTRVSNTKDMLKPSKSKYSKDWYIKYATFMPTNPTSIVCIYGNGIYRWDEFKTVQERAHNSSIYYDHTTWDYKFQEQKDILTQNPDKWVKIQNGTYQDRMKEKERQQQLRKEFDKFHEMRTGIISNGNNIHNGNKIKNYYKIKDTRNSNNNNNNNNCKSNTWKCQNCQFHNDSVKHKLKCKMCQKHKKKHIQTKIKNPANKIKKRLKLTLRKPQKNKITKNTTKSCKRIDQMMGKKINKVKKKGKKRVLSDSE